MDIVIPSVLEKNSVLLMIASLMALLGILIKTVTAILSFYEDVLIKRYFKRVTSLSECFVNDSQINAYLMKLKESEVFRLASGIKVSPESANILMKIYSLGVINNNDLKTVHRFLKPSGDKVLINVTWWDKALFLYSFVISIFVALLGLTVNIVFLINESGMRMYVGTIVMFLCVLAVRILISDYRQGLILQRLKKKLIEHGLLENPDVRVFVRLNVQRAKI